MFDIFDFISEIGSSFRFLYMGFPWVFSKAYREEIRLKHYARNPIIAWLEYTLAFVFFIIWVLLIPGVIIEII